MKNLQQLANSIKASIRRLQAVVQTGRARVAELEQSTHAVDANTKENDAQLKAYRSMRKGIKSNWSKYEARYNKNQAKRYVPPRHRCVLCAACCVPSCASRR
jgi:hypothetical protein